MGGWMDRWMDGLIIDGDSHPLPIMVGLLLLLLLLVMAVPVLLVWGWRGVRNAEVIRAGRSRHDGLGPLPHLEHQTQGWLQWAVHLLWSPIWKWNEEGSVDSTQKISNNHNHDNLWINDMTFLAKLLTILHSILSLLLKTKPNLNTQNST